MAKFAIGYDLGGQSCKVGVFDLETREMLAMGVSKIERAHSAQKIFESICAKTEELVKSQGGSMGDVVSACMATAGTLGPKGAREPIEIDHILISPNIQALNGFSFRQEFEQKYPGMLFLMENDANAAGWAEWFYGIGSRDDVRTLVGFTLGTGLGGYVIIDGVMIRPSELGHIVVDISEDALNCGCKTKGCAEAYVSIDGFRRIARSIMLENTETKMWEIPPDKLDPLPIGELARQGDVAAQSVYSKVGYYLGRLIWNLKRICAPDAVSFSGNIAKSLDLMVPTIKLVLSADPLIEGQPIIQATKQGEDKAGTLGAGGLAIQTYLDRVEK